MRTLPGLERIERDLRYYTQYKESTLSQSNLEPVSLSFGSCQEIRRRLLIMEQFLLSARYATRVMLLELYYSQNQTLEEICHELSISRCTFFRMRKRALLELARALGWSCEEEQSRLERVEKEQR